MSVLLYGTIIALVVVVASLQLAADVRFRRMRITPIAACRDGDRVKVVGTAVALAVLSAPLSGQACIAYRITAIRRKTRPQKVIGRAHFVKFIVKDASGEALVDPDGLTTFGHGHLRLAAAKQRWSGAEVAALARVELPQADQANEVILVAGARVAVRARVAIAADGAVRLVPDKTGDLIVTDERRLLGRA